MFLKKRFYSGLILFIFLSFSTIIVVNASSSMWIQTYEKGANDLVETLIQTSDGGYVIAGNRPAGDEEIANFWVIKTDSSGNLEWNQTYQKTNEHLEVGGLVQTSDGGYVIGITLTESNLNQSILLYKIGQTGNIIWSNTIGSGPDDSVDAIIETSDGGLAIAGKTLVSGNTNDFFFIKTDINGNVEWKKNFGEINNEAAHAIIQTPDEGFALAGHTYSNQHDYDSWLIKTDSYGNMQWSQKFENEYQEIPHALVIIPDSGYVLAGVNFTSPDFDYWLMKTTLDGNIEWKQNYKGIKNGYVGQVGLVITHDKGLTLAGSKGSLSEGINTFLIKMDSSGKLQWNQTQQSSNHDMDFGGIIATSDGGFAIAGQTNYQGIFLIKTDEYGVIPEFDSPILFLTGIITSLLIIIFGKKSRTANILK